MTALPHAGRSFLEGKRVLVTRAAHQAGKLSDELRALGAEPVEVPVLEIQPPESFAPLDAALGNLDKYDWLIFTSENAVRSVSGRAKEQGINLLLLTSIHVAAVGQATAAAVEQIGLNVDLVPDSYVAESLAAALAPRVAGKHVLLARAASARDVIPDALRAAGAKVDVVDAYRNMMPAATPELLYAALEKGIDAATFTSSSSVTHLAAAAQAAGIAFPLARVRAISIGPITSQTLRDLGWEPAAEASRSDIPGLIAAVEQVLRT
jgi:uroporphyrinogen-III synthase/uroporphyrinogen III methyltransferase/synthase